MVCPNCQKYMTTNMSYVGPPVVQRQGEGGFVKGAVTYIVTDKMFVMPLSTVSIMALLKRHGIKEVSTMVENVVHLGVDEVRFISFYFSSQENVCFV